MYAVLGGKNLILGPVLLDFLSLEATIDLAVTNYGASGIYVRISLLAQFTKRVLHSY